jgi:hypothetical protein
VRRKAGKARPLYTRDTFALRWQKELGVIGPRCQLMSAAAEIGNLDGIEGEGLKKAMELAYAKMEQEPSLFDIFSQQFDPWRSYSRTWWQKSMRIGMSEWWLRDRDIGRHINDFGQQFSIRDMFTKLLSFSVPCTETLESIKAFADGAMVEEFMAGTGYWAYLLNKEMGVEVDASDFNNSVYDVSKSPTFYPLAVKDTRTARPNPNSVVMLSWVPYESEEADPLLERMASNQKLILIGESEGGCTAADSTFAILNEKFTRLDYVPIVQFNGLHDRMEFYLKA